MHGSIVNILPHADVFLMFGSRQRVRELVSLKYVRVFASVETMVAFHYQLILYLLCIFVKKGK